MVKHSKNNTNGSTFTYAERQMLKQGTKSERLGRDAMNNFDACSLCLQRVRDPRVCNEGHLFCQECIISSLLSQKQDIKRQTILLERMKEKEATDVATARLAARERVLKEFERTQSGLSAPSTASSSTSLLSKPIVASSSLATAAASASSSSSVTGAGVKRKFDLDSTEIERLALAEEDKAAKKIALEFVESKKSKLTNFWLPSLTPSAAAPVIEVKLQTLCNAAKPAHPLSLKALTVAHFEEDVTDTAAVGLRKCICPVCRKSLSNNVKAFVLKACGHVICLMCVDTLCVSDAQCAHCGVALEKEKKGKTTTAYPGMIELKREGTGFAAGGQAESKRFDLPFQG